MRVLFAGLFLAVLARPALANVETIRTFDPRPYGYFTGDIIERSFEIETAGSDTVTPASLPRPGAVSYWLELRAISHSTKVTGNRATHTLNLTYQTFYAPIDPRKITIPETRLTVETAKGAEDVRLPPFTFITSPLREIFPEKSGETSETFLRPDAPPQLLATRDTLNATLALAGLSLALLALLARHLSWFPFHKRAARPFSQAARDVEHVLSGTAAGSGAYREAALILHRAFDAAAGERLLAADVPLFIERHPEHRDSRVAIEDFFNVSRALFFGEGTAIGGIAASPAFLRDLAGRLRREERGVR